MKLILDLSANCIRGLVWILLAMAPMSQSWADDPEFEKRWVMVRFNAYLEDEVELAVDVVRRAAASGFNGVVLQDTKTDFYWKLDSPDRWLREFRKPQNLATSLGLETVVAALPFGYAGGLLANDPNLSTGYPIRDCPMIAEDGKLIPIQTAKLHNGGFENYDRSTYSFANYSVDDPGSGSFVDLETVKSGSAALRFQDVGSANEHGNGRAYQKFNVEPFQQYQVRVWMRASQLNADHVEIQIWQTEDDRRIQRHPIQLFDSDGESTNVHTFEQFSTDGWLEQIFTFNSLESNQVEILLGMWGGTTGKLWWDDLRVEPVPTLNVLRRTDLPLEIESETGLEVYREETDYRQVIDPLLGIVPYSGSYSMRHTPPETSLPPGSQIADGDIVHLSCHHAFLTLGDQVSCSLTSPGALQLVDTIVANIARDLSPAGYFFRHDEIRSGGWEPTELFNFSNSGAALAFNMNHCAKSVSTHGRQAQTYVWSDMFDPHHNAVDDFYSINNSWHGSWRGLDPNTTIVNWNRSNAEQSLAFFDQLGLQQIIAAYYDRDIEQNYEDWMTAANAAGITRKLNGVMFTTFDDNYDDLEAFALRWWGGKVEVLIPEVSIEARGHNECQIRLIGVPGLRYQLESSEDLKIWLPGPTVSGAGTHLFSVAKEFARVRVSTE